MFFFLTRTVVTMIRSPGSQRDAELADAGAVLAEVDRRLAIGIQVDAAVRRRHVHLDDDELAFEGLLEIPLGLGVDGGGGDAEDDGSEGSDENAHARTSDGHERKARSCGGRTAATGRARHDQDHRIHVRDAGHGVNQLRSGSINAAGSTTASSPSLGSPIKPSSSCTGRASSNCSAVS